MICQITLLPMPPTLSRMDLGHGRGVIKMLLARNLTSLSGIPEGRLINVSSFAVSDGEMR